MIRIIYRRWDERYAILTENNNKYILYSRNMQDNNK